MEVISELENKIFEIIKDRQNGRYGEIKDAARELHSIYVGRGEDGENGLMQSLLRIEQRCGPERPWAGPRLDRLFNGIGGWLA